MVERLGNDLPLPGGIDFIARHADATQLPQRSEMLADGVRARGVTAYSLAERALAVRCQRSPGNPNGT